MSNKFYITYVLLFFINYLRLIIKYYNMEPNNTIQNQNGEEPVIEYFLTYGLSSSFLNSMTGEKFNNIKECNPEVISIYPDPDSKSYIHEILDAR